MKKYFHTLWLLVVISLVLPTNVFAQTNQDMYLENGRFKVGQRDCEKSDTTVKNKAEDAVKKPENQNPEYQMKVDKNKPDPLPPVTKPKQQKK